MFLKSLALWMTFLLNGEAFIRALDVFAHPLFRNFLRLVRFVFRGTLMLWCVLGGFRHLMGLYQLILSSIEPYLNQTMLFLAGPGHISLPVLFMEKLVKVVLGTFLCGCVLLCIQRSRESKNKQLLIFTAAGLSLSVYFVLKDFVLIRKISLNLAEHSLIRPLLYCQLGRISLLIGCTYFMRYISWLPGTSVIYIVGVYAFGIWSLATSATSNLFPIM